MSVISDSLDELLRRRNLFQIAGRSRKYSERPLKSLIAAVAVRIGKLFGRDISLRGRTFWGRRMELPLPEDASIYIWGLIDGEEVNLTRFLADRLKEGNVVADVGSHVGFYTVLASDMVGRTGEVHAFEPTPRSFAFLRVNTTGLSNVSLNAAAAWKEDGTVELSDFGAGSSEYNSVKPSGHSVTSYKDKDAAHYSVRAISLDSYFRGRRRPDFIKLDCEGAEYDVLMGAKEILSSPLLLSIEFSGDEAVKFAQITDFLAKYGYSPYRLEKGQPVPADRCPSVGEFANYIYSARSLT